MAVLGRVARILLGATAALSLGVGAQAADLSYGGEAVGAASDGPHCGVLAGLPITTSIWLGHFTGGNVGPYGPVPGGVDWRNDYACFTSRKACRDWQRGLLAVYRDLEGYRTCLVIR